MHKISRIKVLCGAKGAARKFFGIFFEMFEILGPGSHIWTMRYSVSECQNSCGAAHRLAPVDVRPWAEGRFRLHYIIVIILLWSFMDQPRLELCWVKKLWFTSAVGTVNPTFLGQQRPLLRFILTQQSPLLRFKPSCLTW